MGVVVLAEVPAHTLCMRHIEEFTNELLRPGVYCHLRVDVYEEALLETPQF